MTQPVRILVVDDQTLVREGFRKLLELEADFDVVGTSPHGEAALALLKQLAEQQMLPDIILMDIRMPHLDGIEATKVIKTRFPSIQIVILTTFDDLELIRAGLSAGALGYLLKDVTAEQLASTVRAAAQGRALLQPDIASKVFATLSPEISSSPASPTTSSTMAYVEGLTEREREILRLVAQGASNRQIAERLFITEGTVKNHVSNILSKLGLRDRTQAALYAREHQLL
ncbi:MAG TPA: response regulator transcription factor [Ktedonobacteraceae bacterium]|nr:response regulator transcription factor [Ktedonobacteraceae bacterium]